MSAVAVPIEPASRDTLPVGTELGAYRILRALGAGGMGTVYLAEHIVLGRKVAIKMLHPAFATDPDVVGRFFDEARAANRINHENIVEITDFVTERNYFVMEYLNGRPLTKLKTCRVPLAHLLDIAEQLASALAAAHDAGIIHRDLKPDNVLLVERGGRQDFVKLLDFGIAKLSHGRSISVGETASGMLMGTPGYIAPEHILGKKTDHRCDIYAFGVLLYMLVTGKKPFVADTWPELLAKHMKDAPPAPEVDTTGFHLPRRLVALIMRCLEKDVDQRPVSMQAVRDEITAIAASLGTRAGDEIMLDEAALDEAQIVEVLGDDAPQGVPASRWPLMRRSKRTIATAGAIVAIVAVTIGLTAPATDPADVPAPEPPSRTQWVTSVIDNEPAEDAADVALTAIAVGKERKRAHRRIESAEDGAQSKSAVTIQLELVAQLLKQRAFGQAAQVCESLIKVAPNHPTAHRSLGIAYSGLARTNEACHAFRRYLKLAPAASDRARVETLIGGCHD